ncbi:DUF928 domain-containing protein [Almyronema epifaneia]|uniref:DUF928 domain-containing protein n=1 Tax=Almyronema epifaneia S1 TaxID=2991925 RepID=A0ABW6ICM7_9CYAN
MNLTKSSCLAHKLLGMSVVSLLVAISWGSYSPAKAEGVSQSKQLRAYANSTSPAPVVRFVPPNTDPADDSRGGASRPAEVKCSQDQAYTVPLTALLPTSRVGLTVAAHPTIWVYVPPTVAQEAHFTLRDPQNRGIYQAMLPLPAEGGIMGIQLPEDSPPLALGATYRWSLALMCQPTQTDMPLVDGYIQRIETVADTNTNERSLVQQTADYGQAGVWYDMLSGLIQLQQPQPENAALTQSWRQLLESEGLAELANQPFLELREN